MDRCASGHYTRSIEDNMGLCTKEQEVTTVSRTTMRKSTTSSTATSTSTVSIHSDGLTSSTARSAVEHYQEFVSFVDYPLKIYAEGGVVSVTIVFATF